MGKKEGFRQVTMYVDPDLYDRVKQLAWHYKEDIFEFVGKALESAVERRSNPKLLAAIDMARPQVGKNGQRRERRR